MKKILFVLFILIGFSAFAQDFGLSGQNQLNNTNVQYLPQAVIPLQAVTEEASNLQIAISSRSYPATPGDVYTLTFLLAGDTVSNTLLVESDYTINMTIFGKINAEGMTFPQLKPIIEQKIADAYPRSLPSVTITSVGVFQVPVLGEVPESRFVTAWGLSRLSEVIDGNLTDYSSTRDIKIVHGDGTAETFDILKALNHGELDENPNVKPSDRIIISRLHREIVISGEVYRPGNYQLLDTDDVEQVTYYTGGFTPRADITRIKIDRYTSGRPESFTLNFSSLPEDFNFENGDIITVPTVIDRQPVVYIDGGISGEQTIIEQQNTIQDLNTATQGYNRVISPLKSGETLYDILNSIKDRLLPFADLQHGFVIRGDEIIGVDMQDLIYDFNMARDLTLKPFDRIIIPVNRPEVYVTGAANIPGVYPYNPEEDYTYYVNLAGGFDSLRNKNRIAVLMDKNGNRKDINDPILPGDTVNVLSNDFLYNFNQYFPAITTGLSFIITIITLSQYLNQTYDTSQ